ncbi:MAG: pantetheine-phosphate adenylyltransferase [Mycoplasma sp.]|nr:pantetheine-phosphate adenylyltransferase [Mycoplasma sp.]
MKKAIFAGSFNPFHKGHLSIYNKASKLFDEVILYVTFNPTKNNTESITERADNVRKQLPNAKVIHGTDLTVEVAKKEGCNYLVRGIRDTKDIKSELELANINKVLDESIETVFIIADNNLRKVSSTSINLIEKSKEIAKKNKS